MRQKGHVYRMEFAGGVPLGELREEEESDETGTTITFWASPEIFETTVYDFETIRARFQQMAFLNKGLTISLTDERPDAVDEGAAEEAAADAAAEGADAAQADEAAAQAKKGKSVTYCYADGLLDYVKHLNSCLLYTSDAADE